MSRSPALEAPIVDPAAASVLGLLAPALPDADRTLVLRTLLGEREQARQAWASWRLRYPSLTAVLVGEPNDALAAVLPLLGQAAVRHGLTLDAAEWTRLRTATLREELRARAYGDVLRRCMEALERAGVQTLVLGGRPLAELLYESPALHHTGSIDLLTASRDVASARAALTRAGMRVLAPRADASWTRQALLDPSGLPITLGHAAVAHPCYRLDEDAVWASAFELPAAGMLVRTPALHHQLLLQCLRGSWTGARRSMLWLLDAALLARSPAMDWPALLADARGGAAALPVAAVLVYLRHSVGEPVPADVAAALIAAAARSSSCEMQMALASAARSSDVSVRALLATAARTRRWGTMARWALAPAPAVLAWENGRDIAAPSPRTSLQRLLRFLARRLLALGSKGSAQAAVHVTP